MRVYRTQTMLQKCIFLLAVLIIVTQVLGQESLVSWLFTLTFPLTITLWLLSIRKTIQIRDMLVITIAGISLLHVLINAAITHTSLGFNYLKKLIMFMMSLLFLQTASRTRIDQEMVRFIRRVTDCLTVFLALAYAIGSAQIFVLNGVVTRYLTFGFNNPNMTALLLTCLFVIELAEIHNRRGFYSKAFHVALASMVFWLILQTESRNALIVSILFAIVTVCLLWKSPKKLTVSRPVAAVISVFPLVFSAIYMALITNQRIQKLFGFLSAIGKKLDSRMTIWTRAYKLAAESPIVGAYSQASYGTGTSQLHNTHVDVLVSYGVTVLILVCIFMYCLLYAKGKHHSSKESYIYVLGFICTTLLGIGEAALFSGGMGIYIFMGTLLLLSNQSWEGQRLGV